MMKVCANPVCLEPWVNGQAACSCAWQGMRVWKEVSETATKRKKTEVSAEKFRRHIEEHNRQLVVRNRRMKELAKAEGWSIDTESLNLHDHEDWE